MPELVTPNIGFAFYAKGQNTKTHIVGHWNGKVNMKCCDSDTVDKNECHRQPWDLARVCKNCLDRVGDVAINPLPYHRENTADVYEDNEKNWYAVGVRHHNRGTHTGSFYFSTYGDISPEDLKHAGRKWAKKSEEDWPEFAFRGAPVITFFHEVHQEKEETS